MDAEKAAIAICRFPRESDPLTLNDDLKRTAKKRAEKRKWRIEGTRDRFLQRATARAREEKVGAFVRDVAFIARICDLRALFVVKERLFFLRVVGGKEFVRTSGQTNTFLIPTFRFFS